VGLRSHERSSLPASAGHGDLHRDTDRIQLRRLVPGAPTDNSAGSAYR
jgi:hypothetical protein